jgi:predicted acyl esterase
MKKAALASALVSLACLISVASPAAPALGSDGSKVTPDMIQTASDIPADWKQPQSNFDYVKREVMIPMRDGVKLHTVLLIPKGAHNLPMLLERTPYNTDTFTPDNSPHMADAVWSGDKDWADGSTILVWQDIRGKYGSEGKYIMTRPPMGPLNPTTTDDTTDAWDTIDWLVKNTKESNGNVGMIGSSYDGWTVAMALLHPHPALKAAAPESPMIDGWMGDDWYHYGALRQVNLDYFSGQTSKQGRRREHPARQLRRLHQFPRCGFGRRLCGGQRLSATALVEPLLGTPGLRRLLAEPGAGQAARRASLRCAHHVAARPVGSGGHLRRRACLGSAQAGRARRQQPPRDGPLVAQPDQPRRLEHGTTQMARQHHRAIPPERDDPVVQPLPARHAAAQATARGDDLQPGRAALGRLRRLEGGQQSALTPLYLQADMGLGFEQPNGDGDSYVADPAKPVPYLPRPIPTQNDDQWRTWLVHDQRFVVDRPDVLSYTTPVLSKTVRLEGAPIADLFARTTGTDGDFVVKLIDVYPGTDPTDPTMGGYELPVSLDIFRGRYRKSFADPSPIPANQVQEYKFRLPTVNYEFKPGHRIMVQIQSSLFPLYDRNPQTYVPNILFAKPSDYRKATVTIEHGPDGRSAVLLPVVEGSTSSD